MRKIINKLRIAFLLMLLTYVQVATAQFTPLSVTDKFDYCRSPEVLGSNVYLLTDYYTGTLNSASFDTKNDTILSQIVCIDNNGKIKKKLNLNVFGDTTFLLTGFSGSCVNNTGKIYLPLILFDSIERATQVNTRARYFAILQTDTLLQTYKIHNLEPVDTFYNIGVANLLPINDSMVLVQNKLQNGKGEMYKFNLNTGQWVNKVPLLNIFNSHGLFCNRLNDSVAVVFSNVINYITLDSLKIIKADTVKWQNNSYGGPITGILEFTPSDSSYRSLTRTNTVNVVKFDSEGLGTLEYTIPFEQLVDFGPYANTHTMISDNGAISFGNSIAVAATSIPAKDSFALAFASVNPSATWLKKVHFPYGIARRVLVSKLSSSTILVVIHTPDDALPFGLDAYYTLFDTLGNMLLNFTATRKPSSEPVLFPNPCSSIAHIGVAMPSETMKYTVYTANGQAICSKENSNAIDTKDLAPGLYIVEIFIDNSRYIRELQVNK